MSTLHTEYKLMGFRTGSDGKCFAALAPGAGVSDGRKAIEVPCPTKIRDSTVAKQDEWARVEGQKLIAKAQALRKAS